MDGRLQDFRGDFAGAVSIGIVTGMGTRYQGREQSWRGRSIIRDKLKI